MGSKPFIGGIKAHKEEETHPSSKPVKEKLVGVHGVSLALYHTWAEGITAIFPRTDAQKVCLCDSTE